MSFLSQSHTMDYIKSYAFNVKGVSPDNVKTNRYSILYFGNKRSAFVYPKIFSNLTIGLCISLRLFKRSLNLFHIK